MGDNLYFYAAKLMAFALNPSKLFMTAVALGIVMLMFRSLALWGRRLLVSAMLGYIVLAVFPVSQAAINILEDRFPMVSEPQGPISGIIVLGGSVSTQLTRDRGQVALSGNVERLTEFVRLARAHPQARLVFSGGNGNVFDSKPTEADVSKRFFQEIGFDVSRIEFEDRSRNTTESAGFTFQDQSPKPGETWLLVTSAVHMPRAVGLFRHAGWDVTAYPVDYATIPGAPTSWWPSWPGSLGAANAAAYEWAGLLVAWLRGRSDAFFPGPVVSRP